jgi:hypothetical protein
MSALLDLLHEVDRYLTGASNDRDLEAWVVGNLQRILDSGDATTIHLANEIDALFVEVGEGIIDQPLLKDRLQSLKREAASARWPAGFFEEVVEGWKDEPLERPSQGGFEHRDEL